MAQRRRPPGALAADPILLSASLILAGLGLLNLVAIGEGPSAIHQGIAVLIGVGLFVLAQRTRSHSWPWMSRTAYGVAVLLLLAVVGAGVSAYGARRWLTVGSLVLQPSELAKLGLLLILADVLGRRRLREWHRLLLAGSLAAIPIVLTLLQPDLSTASLLVVITVAALLLARIRLRLLIPLLLATAALLPAAEHFLRPYQAARLHAFLTGAHDTAAGWSLLQAHIAVASGGFFGLAPDPNHQLLAQYLPARQTDLAFASLIEQLGLSAGILALTCVAAMIWRLVAAARSARSFTVALVPGCLAILLGTEATVSVAGSLGLVPLAGVPFPLLSFGGTAAAVHLAAFGLVLGARREGERRMLWRPAALPRKSRPRLMRLSALGLAACFALLANFTYRTQLAEGASLRSYGIDQMTRCLPLRAPRGIIADRHGVPVAVNVPTSQVLVVPPLLHQVPGGEWRLDNLLRLKPGTVARTLAAADPTQLWVPVAGDVPNRVAQPVAALPGVLVVPTERRSYPYGSLFGTILGWVGQVTVDDLQVLPGLDPNARIGRAGLEREYDAVLRGQDGEQCLFVDPQGRAVSLARTVPPIPGAELRLSIDLGLQQTTDAAVRRALQGFPLGYRGDLAAAVVLDARTGAVLAMVSEPSIDNNLYGSPSSWRALERAAEGPGYPTLNHVTQVTAPPGSTFKLVVGSADAVYNVVPFGRVVPTGYIFNFGTASFHNWAWLPPQNLVQAIAWSNDVYFYKLALALGPDRIYNVGHALGVGQPTGIDLPGESPGYLGNPQIVASQGGTWWPGSTVIFGIGQGAVTVTPLQVARWTAAVSTGRLLTPQLALTWSDPGQAFSFVPAITPAPLSFANRLGVVRQGMKLAVQQGTGTMLRDLPVQAGSKTGTAEDPSAPSHQADAWFTAAAPIDNPEVVATVMVRGAGEGYYTSEPTTNTILKYYYAHRGTIQSVSLTTGTPAGPPLKIHYRHHQALPVHHQ